MTDVALCRRNDAEAPALPDQSACVQPVPATAMRLDLGRYPADGESPCGAALSESERLLCEFGSSDGFDARGQVLLVASKVKTANAMAEEIRELLAKYMKLESRSKQAYTTLFGLVEKQAFLKHGANKFLAEFFSVLHAAKGTMEDVPWDVLFRRYNELRQKLLNQTSPKT